MVTGRELEDLFNTFDYMHMFDRVVAENGALLYYPVRDNRKLLATPPPREFVRLLRQKEIPLSVGHCIVATVEPYEHVVLDVIRDLGLEWHVIFNKGLGHGATGRSDQSDGIAAGAEGSGSYAGRDGGNRRCGK
jgi:hydroxymethylpyrimidine pyrophosphatase-like HAD family hydrolase